MTISEEKMAMPAAADLYGELWIAENGDGARARKNWRDLVPGLAIVAVACLAATWLSEHYQMPVILAGLLIGLALNFVSAEPRVHAGLDMCGTNFLRWGIVLLGTQVTVTQIGSLGITSFLALIFIMTLVILAGLAGARLAGQSSYMGWLAGGATAICGASAALAIYALMGKERLNHNQFTLTLVGISLASATALSFYPLLASYFGFTDQQAGFLMGAAIHDVAQSLGAGYSFSEGSGEFATIVKLSRVALLAPFVAVIGLAIMPAGQRGKTGIAAKLRLPWFVIGFFLLVAVNSLVNPPAFIAQYGLIASKVMLLSSVTATAMRSQLNSLMSQGWRPLIPVVTASLTAFVAAFLYAGYFLS